MNAPFSGAGAVTDHGGNRTAAAARFGVAAADWLDLSTGINPFAYPLPVFPADDWTRLPDADLEQAAEQAARRAYGAAAEAAVCLAPGSQALIQMLPLAWRRADRRAEDAGTVWILGPTYAEHARCWALGGYAVQEVGIDHPLFDPACPVPVLPPDLRVLVVVNPDNPTGRVLSAAVLERLRAALAAQGGLLVCDEAFADSDPATAVDNRAGTDGLIVLRSFGKFYGLAGVRLGVALGAAPVIAALSDLIGPWAVSGPALRCAAVAYADDGWAAVMRQRLATLAARLDAVVLGSDPGFRLVGGTTLFRLYAHPQAQAVYEGLGRQGILVRRFDSRPDQLRFGLPDEAGLDRLTQALRRWG
ncbi:threonine-phosphate decarboxylase CobD [Novispirillum itersonii]|uniref:threonine-phosphate decarboxylase n=1 Tax=Novispirillum itersonii TaxID=189 RepID=A0A7X0DN49_NOVIT|nr:threonine-phosphate decarboxylase CobD [Novispirillum itersonii]MBB6211635.1 cobalamin biosynthetic protein CobC [Novispirillum itersonii]